MGKERSSWIYSHSCFRKGKPELLLSLRRKTNGGGCFYPSRARSPPTTPEKASALNRNAGPSNTSNSRDSPSQGAFESGMLVNCGTKMMPSYNLLRLPQSRSSGYSPLCSLQDSQQSSTPTQSPHPQSSVDLTLCESDGHSSCSDSLAESEGEGEHLSEPRHSSASATLSASLRQYGLSPPAIQMLVDRFGKRDLRWVGAMEMLWGNTWIVLDLLHANKDFAYELLLYMQMLQYPVESMKLLSAQSSIDQDASFQKEAMDLLSHFIVFTVNILDDLCDQLIACEMKFRACEAWQLLADLRMVSYNLGQISQRLAAL